MSDLVSRLVFGNACAFNAADLAVQGEIPDYVKGNYYINGPSKYQRGELHYKHWLEGDAMVRKLNISDGKVNYRSAYVGSRKHRDEAAEGAPIYRNFATAFEGDLLNEQGVALEANICVSVYPYKNRLVSFGEQALPLELDPENLATLGQCNFEGALAPLAPFSGHPKFDPKTRRLCNFGVNFVGKRGMLHYYEFDEDLKLKQKGSTTLPMPICMHDFAVSDKYACFFAAPFVLDVRAMINSGQSMYHSLKWLPEEETVLVIMSRESGRLAARIPLGRSTFSLHMINAFSRGEELVVDLIESEAPFFDQYFRDPMFPDIKSCSTLRIVVDTQTWERTELLGITCEKHLDFPSIDRAHTAADYDNYWILGMPAAPAPTPKFYNELLRFDWRGQAMTDSYSTPAGFVLSGEPALAADPKEKGRGVIINQMHELSSGETSYVFFDAFNLKAGPVATVPLHQFGAIGLHSAFQPASF